MINCVIIDDEKNCREDLMALIERHFKDRLLVAGAAASVNEGVTIIHRTMPDLVFLDIRMPEKDGFQLFKEFEQINFEVVFTTAYGEYALQAIKHAALDYLMKPVDPKELLALLQRLETNLKKKNVNYKINRLLEQIETGAEKSILVSLPTGKEFKVINANDIIYCQADINYTNIFTTDGTKILVTKTLGRVEMILDYPFFYRCHKSYLVNLNHIDTYSRIDGYIKMKNKEIIYLAGRRIEDFINLFGKKQ